MYFNILYIKALDIDSFNIGYLITRIRIRTFIPTPNLYSIVYHNFDPTNKKVQGCNKHLFAKREVATLE